MVPDETHTPIPDSALHPASPAQALPAEAEPSPNATDARAADDVQPDVSPDVQPDVQPDIQPDVQPDVQTDASLDASPDVQPDTLSIEPETGLDVPTGAALVANQVLGIKFREHGQLYFFNAAGFELRAGEHVVVETEQGLSMGQVVLALDSRDRIPPDYAKDLVGQELKPVLRIADAADLDRHAQNLDRGRDAWHVCRRLVREHDLEMKLVDVEVLHDQSKILFYFTAPNRIDFRELVKDLVKEFHTRIELRQIGVRHETQMIGAIGNCGLVCCCRQFLRKFAPVTIKMAKEQNLFLNPTKISGMCGRLLCCLSFEQENYEHFHKQCPKIGKKYLTSMGPVKVLRANFFRNSLSVYVEGEEEREVTLEDWEAMDPRRPDPNQQQQQQQEQARAVRQERAERGEKTARPDRAERPERAERPRPDKPRKERAREERRQGQQGQQPQPEQPDRPDRPDRPQAETRPALRAEHLPAVMAPAAVPQDAGDALPAAQAEALPVVESEVREHGVAQAGPPEDSASTERATGEGQPRKSSRNRRRKRKPRNKRGAGEAPSPTSNES